MPNCNCHPPFPRPEPFSPLPHPGRTPDWGKWVRDRLAEKGALLAFPTRTAFPPAGSAPNLYLAEDTGVVYRWGGEGYAVLVDPSPDVEVYPGRSTFPDTGRTGVVYIDASANLLYRWDGTGYVLLTSDLSGVESRLADVESKVPAQATAQNQLADKAFVNSSIATNTAFYISDNGRPFQSLADLESYEGALTNNDYAFVVGRDAAGNTTYTRYKWNEATEAWGEEYVLNNSSFTAAQWAAISSGITSGLVAKLGALPTAEALATALAGKQDALTFDNAPTAGSNNPVKSSGIWSAIWGALSALPAGFASLYDWCINTFFKASSVAIPFGSRRWLLGDLCSYNGVVYRCKTPYTSTGSSATPDADTAHWEVKRASELFLRLVGDNSVNGSVSAGYAVDNDGGFCAIGAFADGGYAEVGRTGIAGYTRYRDGKIEYLAPGQVDAQTISLPAKSGIVALDSDATLTPVYSDTPTFSKWTILRDGVDVTAQVEQPYWQDDPDKVHFDELVISGTYVHGDNGESTLPREPRDAVALSWYGVSDGNVRHSYTATRTRTDIIGYTLGDQSDKPLQPKGDYPTKAQMDAGWWSEWELAGSLPFDAEIIPSTSSRPNPAYHLDPDHWQLEVLYNGDVKIGACSGSEDADRLEIEFDEESGLSAYTVIATRHRVAAPVPTKPEDIGAANRAANPTAGNLATLDSQGNPTDSLIPAANVATKGDIPYYFSVPMIVENASSEVVEGETVYYAEVTLADRTANFVQVTAATPLDELRITFPAATSGKVRDFGLRVEIGTGSAALTAPALVPIAPTGETIKIENSAAEIPALADGTATAKGVTLLYFSETAPGVFVVKGEQVEEVA